MNERRPFNSVLLILQHYTIDTTVLVLHYLGKIDTKTVFITQLAQSRAITQFVFIQKQYQVPGGTKKNKYGEAPPRGPTPYPFIYHFGKKDTPFVYFTSTNGTPFVYLPLENSTLSHINYTSTVIRVCVLVIY